MIQFILISLLLGSVGAYAQGVAPSGPVTVTDKLIEVPITNGNPQCYSPRGSTCPPVTTSLRTNPLGVEFGQQLVLHLSTFNCFYGRGVFSLWDGDTLRFFYSIGTADGDACSAIAGPLDVPLSLLWSEKKKFYLKQMNGKRTQVSFEVYQGPNNVPQVKDIVILPDQD